MITLAILVLSPLNATAQVTINPFVKGTLADIKKQHEGKPFVLIFWSESCGYCLKELAMFGKLSKQYPGVDLVTVATDPFLEEATVQNILSASQLNLEQTWVFAEQFPEVIYTDVNRRWRGELPLTHLYSKEHTETRVMGSIKQEEIIKWLNEQSSVEP